MSYHECLYLDTIPSYVFKKSEHICDKEESTSHILGKMCRMYLSKRMDT